jgi:hypothetical protein
MDRTSQRKSSKSTEPERILLNKYLTQQVGGCSRGGGVLKKPNLIPKTTIASASPVALYIYSEKESIPYIVDPFYDALQRIAYDYARRIYNHQTEGDVFNEVSKKEPYPSIKEVIKLVDPIAQKDKRFRDLIDHKKDELFMRYVDAQVTDDDDELEHIIKNLTKYIDSIYPSL